MLLAASALLFKRSEIAQDCGAVLRGSVRTHRSSETLMSLSPVPPSTAYEASCSTFSFQPSTFMWAPASRTIRERDWNRRTRSCIGPNLAGAYKIHRAGAEPLIRRGLTLNSQPSTLNLLHHELVVQEHCLDTAPPRTCPAPLSQNWERGSTSRRFKIRQRGVRASEGEDKDRKEERGKP